MSFESSFLQTIHMKCKVLFSPINKCKVQMSFKRKYKLDVMNFIRNISLVIIKEQCYLYVVFSIKFILYSYFFFLLLFYSAIYMYM